MTLCAASILTVAAGVTPAVASSELDADAIARVVEHAAPTPLDAVGLERSGESLISPLAGRAVELGVDPAGGLTLSAGTAVSATVSLPGAARLRDAVVSDDGSVTFVGDEKVPSVNVMTAENTVRVATVISSDSQPEEFSYEFGAGASVEIQDDGSALVVTRSFSDPSIDIVVATIHAPWATDAAGNAVETSYIANGSSLVQVVKHQGQDVAYPVVADPSFDQPNFFQYRARFNRAETKTIAQYGLASLGGAACGPVMALPCMLAAGVVAYNAGVAENSKPKRCVQITATNTYSALNVVWWVDTYAGGACK